jgi:hypothetical protein
MGGCEWRNLKRFRRGSVTWSRELEHLAQLLPVPRPGIPGAIRARVLEGFISSCFVLILSIQHDQLRGTGRILSEIRACSSCQQMSTNCRRDNRTSFSGNFNAKLGAPVGRFVSEWPTNRERSVGPPRAGDPIYADVNGSHPISCLGERPLDRYALFFARAGGMRRPRRRGILLR